MTQLTEERFEEILTQKLDAQTKLFTEQNDQLARLASAGFARAEEHFDALETRLDVTEQIHAFERKFQKLEEALHIKL
jgi:hypothetical protein